MLKIDHRFLQALPGDPEVRNFVRPVHGALWSEVMPTPVPTPRLLAHSPEVAALLGLSGADLGASPWLDVLAGNALLPGMRAYATCYGGHQFGQWAGQLGDGRALLLGAVRAVDGSLQELQLKGAGPTPYSRHADGRAVLRSSLREFLCSEAMHHLGIPTTRALSLIGSGDMVVRDMFYDGHPRPEPGAVVCRVAPSFLRFGHFELPAARGDSALLQALVDYAIDQVGPDDDGQPFSGAERISRWFACICARTARLLAQWMQVGFVHGVMNTDNMSILGLTIDYGPYGWVEELDPAWTPNTTDAQGRRYCFGRQPEVARWNLAQLAGAIAGLVVDPDTLAAGLETYDAVYAAEASRRFAGKLGLRAWMDGDEALLGELFAVMQAGEIDMTDGFRRLADIDPAAPAADVLAPASYRAAAWQAQRPALQAWLQRYAQRLRADARPTHERIAVMQAHNPRFVCRNYLAQQAIDAAEGGDVAPLLTLLDTLRRPWDEQPERAAFAAIRPEWARQRPGCAMLSCSS